MGYCAGHWIKRARAAAGAIERLAVHHENRHQRGIRVRRFKTHIHRINRLAGMVESGHYDENYLREVAARTACSGHGLPDFSEQAVGLN